MGWQVGIYCLYLVNASDILSAVDVDCLCWFCHCSYCQFLNFSYIPQGIFLGTAANVVLKDVGSRAWRYQLASAFLPAVLLLFIFLCPESPRWLMKKNRYPEAYQSLIRLRFTPLQAARDMYYIHVQLQEEGKITRGETYIKRFIELFTIPRVRRATRAAFVVVSTHACLHRSLLTLPPSVDGKVRYRIQNNQSEYLYSWLNKCAVSISCVYLLFYSLQP